MPNNAQLAFVYFYRFTILIRRYYLVAITLLTTGVVALLFAQGYWLNNAYQSEKYNFENTMLSCLNDASVCINWYEEEVLNFDSATLAVLATHIGKLNKEERLFFTKKIKRSKADTTLLNKIKGFQSLLDYTFLNTTNWDSVAAQEASVLAARALIDLRTRIVKKYILRSVNRALQKRHFDIAYQVKITCADEVVFRRDTTIADTSELLVYNLLEPIRNTYSHYIFDTEEEPSIWLMHLTFYQADRYVLNKMKGVITVSLAFTLLLVFNYMGLIRMLIKNKQETRKRTEMMSDLTHELKNPLSTILLAAEQISTSKATDTESIQLYANIIKEEDKRILKYVESVLNLSHFESEMPQLHKEPVLIGALVKKVVSGFELQIQKSGGIIRFTDDSENAIIWVDKDKIILALINLIDNAIKYAKQQPEVLVHVYSDKDYLRMSISDKGTGIAAPEIKRIFDRFYRVRTTDTNGTTTGHGMGLTFVKSITELHKGHIEVKSEINVGSTFMLSLPIN